MAPSLPTWRGRGGLASTSSRGPCCGKGRRAWHPRTPCPAHHLHRAIKQTKNVMITTSLGSCSSPALLFAFMLSMASAALLGARHAATSSSPHQHKHAFPLFAYLMDVLWLVLSQTPPRPDLPSLPTLPETTSDLQGTRMSDALRSAQSLASPKQPGEMRLPRLSLCRHQRKPLQAEHRKCQGSWW